MYLVYKQIQPGRWGFDSLFDELGDAYRYCEMMAKAAGVVGKYRIYYPLTPNTVVQTI